MKLSIDVDSLREPPVVGKTYRVRCVNFISPEESQSTDGEPQVHWLPVLGIPHTDRQIGSIAACNHVHFDFRFITCYARVNLSAW